MKDRPGVRRLFRLALYDRWTTRRDVEEETCRYEPGLLDDEPVRVFTERTFRVRRGSGGRVAERDAPVH